MRYLGGVGDPPSGNFLTATATGMGVYYPSSIGYEPNEEAVFADFIAPLMCADSQIVAQVCADNIRNLGNGDLLNGYREMRDFIGARFPLIADALGHMATMHLRPFAANVTVSDDSDITAADMAWDVADQLHIFFHAKYFEYPQIGVDPTGRNLGNLQNEIKSLYNPHIL
jgi:hypothetical protein